MAREVLKGIKSENRLSKVRLIMPNDPVIGGQPSDNADEFTSNTPFLDLACSIQYAVTAASNADKKAGTAQTTANEAKTAAAAADSKAVAAQNTANTANTAASNADKKAGTAQTTANEAKTAAAAADSKAVAAQNTANTANTAASNADKKAGTAQTTANEAKTAAAAADSKAVAAQNKANQVPAPILDQMPIGASATAYKLITIDDLKKKLGVPAAQKLYSGTGQATDGAMTQNASTNLLNKKQDKKILKYRKLSLGINQVYTNTSSDISFLLFTVLANRTSTGKIYIDSLGGVIQTTYYKETSLTSSATVPLCVGGTCRIDEVDSIVSVWEAYYE